MLIIPLTEKISFKNPPYITIFLIIVNIFIYFAFQLNDNENFYNAEKYYFESGLAEIEIPEYQKYMKTRKDHEEIRWPDQSELSRKEFEKQLYALHRKIETDRGFLIKLHNDQIIISNDENYNEWKSLRENYDFKMKKVVFHEYGFTPAWHKPFTFLSHMFLHGGAGHLFGNMIFLWIAGCLVEAGSKKGYYFPAYILSGFASVALFWAINYSSLRPLVGASGAISGLMGIVTTMYGRKKIKVFFSVGFYFNYLRAPAIMLLPIWIGKEIWSFYFGGPSSTAYMAHVGGFIGGAALGYLNIRFLKMVDNDALVEEKESNIPGYLEEAMACSGRLEFDNAKKILEKALEEEPGNTVVLEQLYKTVKAEPESSQFHITTRKILSLLSRKRENYSLIHRIYTDYAAVAKVPKLPAKLFIKLCSIFATLGHTDKTEKILLLFLRKKPDTPQIPDALFKLALAFKKSGDHKKFTYYKKILTVKYPGTNEADNIKHIAVKG